MNFFRTVSAFRQNRYVNPYGATLRHSGWILRKLFNNFPCDLRIRNLVVRIADRSIANGCGALLNAMGYYDPNNMLFIEEFFRDGRYQTFFDVGANIGVYSLIAAAQSSASKVCAFEPHPYTFALLEENVRLNRLENQISSYRRALNDQDGTVLLLDQAGSPENRVVDKADKNKPTLQVQCSRGESFCHEKGIIPQVLKIDVEGFENHVLAGFENVLDRIEIILVECWNIEKTIELLRNHAGFQGPYKIDHKRRRFVSGNIHYEDWVFVNPSAVATLGEWIPLG